MSYIIINGLLLLWNYIHAAVFPSSFPEESMAAGNNNALKAAWHLTSNPPPPQDMIDVPTDTDATLRTMTFRLHKAESKLAEAGIVLEETPEPPAKGSPEPELAAKV